MSIQFEKVRQIVDPKFLAVAKDLEDSYYGTFVQGVGRLEDGWRNGVSHPFVNGGNVYDWNPLAKQVEKNGVVILSTSAENAKLSVPEKYDDDDIDPMDNVLQRTSEVELERITAIGLLGYSLTV
jgi:hypothetical protein